MDVTRRVGGAFRYLTVHGLLLPIAVAIPDLDRIRIHRERHNPPHGCVNTDLFRGYCWHLRFISGLVQADDTACLRHLRF